VTALQIIIFIFLLFILLAISLIALRRWVRGIYFQRLDREMKRLEPLVKMFLERKIISNSTELRFRPNTIPWQALENCLFKARELSNDEDKMNITALFEKLSYLKYYQGLLRSGHRWERALAAEKLGRIGPLNGTRHLIDALKDPSKDVRSVALRSLAMVSDVRSFPLLTKELPQMAKREDGVFISTLKNALVSLGEPIVPFLLDKIDRYDERMLSIVIESLGEIGSREGVPALVAQLAYTNPEIRAKAAKALGKINDPSAIPSLLGMENEPIWFVRLQVCRALGLTKDPRGIHFLTIMLLDENWQVRTAAAESLRRISAPVFSDLATILMVSGDRYAKEQIAEEMQRSGIVDELINSLDHPDDRAVELNKDMLAALVSLGVTSILKRAAEIHPSERVRLQASTILKSVERSLER
jgi:HEAT repeat protein